MNRPRLVLEGGPTQVAVARAFAGAVMRVLELDDERVAAIRLAVSELVTQLVLDGADTLELQLDGEVLRLARAPSGITLAPPVLEPARMDVVSRCRVGAPTPNAVGGWDLPLQEMPA